MKTGCWEVWAREMQRAKRSEAKRNGGRGGKRRTSGTGGTGGMPRGKRKAIRVIAYGETKRGARREA
jgi:hypothetical protein